MAPSNMSCSCSSFIKNLLFCGACYSRDHPQDPAIPAPPLPAIPAIPAPDHSAARDIGATSLLLQIIPANTTIDSLDRLIQHLEKLSTSVDADPFSEEWKERTKNIPAFLDSLPGTKDKIMVGVEISKDTLLPLLGKVLGEIGSLHWAAFGLSMLAWGIEIWDRKHQNSAHCICILKDAIELLKHTRHLWEQDQSIVISSNDLMQSTLPAIAEVAFRASAIFVSCGTAHKSSKIKRCVKILGTYIAAASLEESISAVKADIMKLLVKNGLIKQQQMYKKLDTIQEQTKSRRVLTPQFSKLRTLEDEPLRGRQELAEKVEGILKKDFGKEIIGVCIHGMGGVGKSTLGLHIYNDLLQQFKVHCWVELDLDTKKTDLPRFQKQILNQINSRGDKIYNSRDGREMLLRAFKDKHMPILLFLDNMDDPKLVPEFLPSLYHLPEGSRLLVTTRNLNVSGAVDELMNVHVCHPIELKVLDANASRSLLREEALKKTENKELIDSNQSLKELEREVLSLCGGLPLALKVIGSFICTWNRKKDIAGGSAENADTWRYVINAMKEARPLKGDKEDELYARLRVSIDALDDQLRMILSDIAMCQLNKYFSKDQLESIFGAEDLQHLIDRHLILEDEELDYSFYSDDFVELARVSCHDVIASLVSSMASSSESKELHYLTGEDPDFMRGENVDLMKVIKDDHELASIICLMRQKLADVHQLNKMEQLRYAIISVSSYNVGLIELKNLKALILGSSIVGRMSSPLSIVCPELRLLSITINHDLELGDLTSCTKLEYLQLFCHEKASLDHLSFTYTPAIKLHLVCFGNSKVRIVLPESIISGLKALKTISLSYCTSFKSISESISRLPSLEKLKLHECDGLQSHPNVMFENVSSNLICLALISCQNLQVLPQGISKLTTLKWLNLEECKSLKSIHKSIWGLSSLQYLNLHSCNSLECLPDVMFENVSSNLELVNLSNCEKLEVLPEGISKLTALKQLKLEKCKLLKSIPESIWGLPSLENLDLSECNGLESLPDVTFENASSNLIQLNLSNCEKLEVLPEGISKLTALQWLDLQNCKSLKSIPKYIWRLPSSEILDLSECNNLQSLPDVTFENVLSNLIRLNLFKCEKLEVLPEGISKLTTLKELNLKRCKSLKSIPESIWGLPSLEKLDLSACNGLECLPDVMFENVSSNLQLLNLYRCEKLEVLPEGISKLTALKQLKLEKCKSLRSIPESIWGLPSLQNLDLSECNGLESLPDVSFENASNSLIQLNLSNCEKLEVLPEGISKLTTLKWLDLQDCKSLMSIPESIWGLLSLESLNLCSCNALESLPDVTFENVSSNITQLTLSSCEKLEVLPEGISKLTALKWLNLEYCKLLKSIPQSIWGLPCLQHLNLQFCNGLESLPDVMFENVSSNLVWLNLSGCKKLAVLPEGISKLTALKQLNLRLCTSLKSIPESIRGLPSLKVLNPEVIVKNISRRRTITTTNTMMRSRKAREDGQRSCRSCE